MKIIYTSENCCQLKLTAPSLTQLGSYAVEAGNVHGLVRTAGSLNVGQPRHKSPPKFRQLTPEKSLTVQPKVAFNQNVS